MAGGILGGPTYKIEIDGHIGLKWAAWFDGLTICQPDDKTTVLSGTLPDQTALHSVLNKIRDMNRSLRSVQRIEGKEENP